MPVEFSKISASQFESFPREKTVFFFPVGPLEDHGPHLPMGLDLEEAARLCSVTAQHLEEEMPGWVGIVMPIAPLGIDSNTTHFAITVRPHVLRDWLVDSCRSLIRLGFFHFVCFSGHLGPRQLTAIEEAGKLVRSSGKWRRVGRLVGVSRGVPSLLSASSTLVKPKEVLNSPFWPDPKEHGGKRDTSIALAIVEDRVDPNYRYLPSFDQGFSHSWFSLGWISRWKRNFKRRTHSLSGYWGTPADSRAEEGEKEIFESMEEVFPKMRAVWEGANPNSLFRSWYSILPPNKSFFKSWLLALCILIVLAALGFLNPWSFSQ